MGTYAIFWETKLWKSFSVKILDFVFIHNLDIQS